MSKKKCNLGTSFFLIFFRLAFQKVYKYAKNYRVVYTCIFFRVITKFLILCNIQNCLKYNKLGWPNKDHNKYLKQSDIYS